MDKILIILDGMGDLPTPSLQGKTPLEVAKTPNLDYLAEKGKLGYLYPISEKVAPESDTAVIAILGNDFRISSRGQFEAKGTGIKLERGDLALRANFATIDNLKSKKVIDRRAGRTLTTKEARELSKALNKEIKLPSKFKFYSTIQHRGVLVFKGGFSDNITSTDTYQNIEGKIKLKEEFAWSEALDEEENTEYTVNLVNSFMDQAFKILENHKINEERRKKGLMPANFILLRDPGVEIPKIKKFENAMGIVNMPLEKGICSIAGMDVYSCSYPTLKSPDVYKNLSDSLYKMIKYSSKVLKKKRKKYDFAYVHFKETDLPGHDNKPHEKIRFLEELDKRFFSFLRNYVEKNKIKLLITADHSTPCKLKTHTSDPVPVLFYNPLGKPDKCNKFSEVQMYNGELGKLYGNKILEKTLFKKNRKNKS